MKNTIKKPPVIYPIDEKVEEKMENETIEKWTVISSVEEKKFKKII